MERDVPLHQPGQAAHDGQAKAGPDMAAPRAAHDLRELFERAGDVVRRHPDAGVLNLDGDAFGVGTVDLDPHMALIGELQRIAHQVVQDLDQPHLVAEAQFSAAKAADDQFDALFDGGDLVQSRDAEQDIRQADRARVKHQPPGFDLREVENIVDHAKEVLAGIADHPDHRLFLRVRKPVAQNGRHAEDTVEGGADLVAHRGQEVGLGAVGGFGGGHRGAEPVLVLHLVGDVGEGADDGGLGPGGREAGRGDGDDTAFARGPVEVAADGVHPRLSSQGAGDGQVVGRDVVAVGIGDTLGADQRQQQASRADLAADDPLGGGVGEDHRAAFVDHHDARDRRLHDPGQGVAFAGQRKFKGFGGRDVEIDPAGLDRAAVFVPFGDLGAGQDPDPVPVAVAQADLVFHLPLAGFEGVALLGDQAFGVVGVQHVKPGLQRDRVQFDRAEAEDFGPAVADQGDTRAHVMFPGADLGAVDHLAQPHFGLGLDRDVQRDARDPARTAIGPPRGDMAAGQKPDPLAALVAHPAAQRERLGAGQEQLALRLGDGKAVLGVDQFDQIGQSPRRAEAQHRLPAVGDRGEAAVRGPVPDRDAAAVDDLLQPPVRKPARGDILIKTDGLLRGRGAFADPDQPAIGQFVLVIPHLGQWTVEASLQVLVVAFAFRTEDAAVDGRAQKVIVKRTLADQVGDLGEDPDIGRVPQDQPILGVEDGKAVVQRLDCGQEAGAGCLQRVAPGLQGSFLGADLHHVLDQGPDQAAAVGIDAHEAAHHRREGMAILAAERGLDRAIGLRGLQSRPRALDQPGSVHGQDLLDLQIDPGGRVEPEDILERPVHVDDLARVEVVH